MSPAEVGAALGNVCFAPGIWWDAESLARFFGCSASQIGSIPGMLHCCGNSPEGVRQFEFEHPYLSIVQVAKAMGKSRTAIARLTQRGRLNPRRGPNNAALFLMRDVCAFNGWTIPDGGPIDALARTKSSTSHPANSSDNIDRLRALLLEDVRLFEQLEESSMDPAAQDKWDQYIAVRLAAVGAEVE